jgi:hypothetical protein
MRLASALVVAGALGSGGCGGERPGAGPYADLVARYVPRIEKETGLRFKRPPAVAERSRDEVAVFVRQQLASERAQRQLAGQEAAYRLLGLIPDTMRLDALLQRLLEEQVVGYYDPRTDTLYVVGGAPKALLEQTVAHELVHALQDQYVKVDSIQEQVEDADRQLAAQAVLEGQAVSLQLRTNPNAGPMMKMPGGWDRIRDMIRDGQGGMPVFAAAPMAIREGLLFPYLGGADFVRRYILQRPESTLYGDLPVSTAQLLHDDAYFTDAASRLRPTAVEQQLRGVRDAAVPDAADHRRGSGAAGGGGGDGGPDGGRAHGGGRRAGVGHQLALGGGRRGLPGRGGRGGAQASRLGEADVPGRGHRAADCRAGAWDAGGADRGDHGLAARGRGGGGDVRGPAGLAVAVADRPGEGLRSVTGCCVVDAPPSC